MWLDNSPIALTPQPSLSQTGRESGIIKVLGPSPWGSGVGVRVIELTLILDGVL